MGPRLTIAKARDLTFEDLIEEVDKLLEPYTPRAEGESTTEQRDRISRTIDEVPELYRWFLTLQSWFDHWTDAYADQFGMRDSKYKQMRERRDAMDRAAKAAKMRYDGASRLVTVLQGFDPEGMPTGRKG